MNIVIAQDCNVHDDGLGEPYQQQVNSVEYTQRQLASAFTPPIVKVKQSLTLTSEI